MKVEHVLNCSFPNWYKNFESVTIKSAILLLPDGFPEYILKDGIVLPKNSEALYAYSHSSSDDSDSEVDWENSNAEEAEAPNFPEFDESIRIAIEDLGGKVFPKLNWSSPRDASWIALNSSCCCTTVSDVYLLLKSSDFIVHDLTKPFEHCEDFEETFPEPVSQLNQEFYLILRKWTEIDTSGEFRCFVKNNNLIDVFDVYRKKEKHVRLLDFNPFCEVTDALLFKWKELEDESFVEQDNDLPVFRYVHENHGVQPRPLGYYAVPRDVIDITSGEDSFKFVDLLKLKIEEQGKESSSEDDNDGNDPLK